MVITLKMIKDSENTYPTDYVEIDFDETERGIGIRFTDSQRVVRVSVRELAAVLKVILEMR